MDRPIELDTLKSTLHEHLPFIQREYGVDTLGIFGSYVRGEEQLGSDLDVLVTFSEVPGLFRFIALEHYLTDLLGVQVDLVMADALKPNIGQNILAEVEQIK